MGKIDPITGLEIREDSSYAIEATWLMWECEDEEGKQLTPRKEGESPEHILSASGVPIHTCEVKGDHEPKIIGSLKANRLDAMRWRNEQMGFGRYYPFHIEFIKPDVTERLVMACRDFYNQFKSDEFGFDEGLNAVGGHLHICLDDGNMGDSSVNYCLESAREGDDADAVFLARVLLAFPEDERRALRERYADYCWVDDYEFRGSLMEKYPYLKDIAF